MVLPASPSDRMSFIWMVGGQEASLRAPFSLELPDVGGAPITEPEVNIPRMKIMGMDFSALLKYQWAGEKSMRVVASIEADSPAELKQVQPLWKQCEFSEQTLTKATWVENLGSGVEIPRPDLPNLLASLSTPEDFFITFGVDAVRIYHVLRWRQFLVDSRWQEVMLQACHALCRLFGATEGIVTNDESPVIEAFFEGASFDDALAAGQGVYGEVSDVKDLYLEPTPDLWDSTGYWKFLKKE
jgi:hypothetical protein